MRFHVSHVVLSAVLACSLAAGCAAVSTAENPPRAVVRQDRVFPARASFQAQVRADYFAGISGDEIAFARAMKACDDALAANGDDADALVWRGAGRLFESRRAADRRTLFARGIAEMDRAVAIAPDQVAVRIPRGAVLLAVAEQLEPERARPLVERALADYEAAMRIQAPRFQALSRHAREELLFGIADADARLGRNDAARAAFERLASEIPDSTLVPFARAWLAGSPPAHRPACNGCHGG